MLNESLVGIIFFSQNSFIFLIHSFCPTRGLMLVGMDSFSQNHFPCFQLNFLLILLVFSKWMMDVQFCA